MDLVTRINADLQKLEGNLSEIAKNGKTDLKQNVSYENGGEALLLLDWGPLSSYRVVFNLDKEEYGLDVLQEGGNRVYLGGYVSLSDALKNM